MPMMNAPWDCFFLYFTTSMVDFLTVNVSKHTSPMDPVGIYLYCSIHV